MNLKHKNESGRSMVEMLGTLAIIGVLSIGGIVGYSYGMDKYRANETINDVNLRMIDIITHITQGRKVSEISSEFDKVGRAGYTIDLFQNVDGEPSIMVEKVPSSVCKHILKNTPDTQDIFVGVKSNNTVDGAWYLGDNDDICNGGDKEMLFSLNETILAGLVNKEDSKCQSDSDCSADKPYCDSGTCLKCISHNNCGENEYCADMNQSCTSATKGGGCKDLDFNAYTIDGITYYVSNKTMSWWDNYNACEALSKKVGRTLSMITVQELATLADGSAWTITSGEKGNGWDTFTPTALAQKLKELHNERVWTSILSSNTCYAYSTYLNGYVVHTGYYRNGSHSFAVCR